MPWLIANLTPKFIRQPICQKCARTMTVKGIRTVKLWEQNLFQYLSCSPYICKGLLFHAVSFSGKLNWADFYIIGEHGLHLAIRCSTVSPSLRAYTSFESLLSI